jgi:hypothetical protein
MVTITRLTCLSIFSPRIHPNTPLQMTIITKLADAARETGRQGGDVYISVIHDGGGSNIRWLYVGDDKNMLNAFGGADMSLEGCAHIKSDGTISGKFLGKISDLYEWDKSGFGGNLKQFASQVLSSAYDAAFDLQTRFGYPTFDNEVKFTADKPFECD